MLLSTSAASSPTARRAARRREPPGETACLPPDAAPSGTIRSTGIRDVLAPYRCRGEPDPRLYVAAELRLEGESGGGHPGFELRDITEQPRVQDEITVGGVGGDGEISGARAQVDGLRPSQNDGVTVRRQRCQGIEQDTSRGEYIASNPGNPGGSSVSVMGARMAVAFYRGKSPARLVLRHPRDQRLTLSRHPAVARQAVNGGLRGRHIANPRILAASLPDNGIERSHRATLAPSSAGRSPRSLATVSMSLL